MAFKGKIISHRGTGQSIRFLQTAKDTDGQLLEMESTFRPHSKEPVPHYHPYQEEFFTVVSGTLSVRMHERVKEFGSGDTLHIPANTVHSMWNNSESQTVVNWKVQPAMETEYLLEAGIGLANDGGPASKPMPNILHLALLANRFNKVYRASKPPFVFQRVLFSLLTPVAWLLGYRPNYRKYFD
jgi:quercetin dioxygenase-like cupin family protein